MKKIFMMAVSAVILAVAMGFTASAQAETHIYINQAVGKNLSTTSGTATDPFKSITYAFLTMKNKNAADPWIVHIKAGTYDSDTAKPANEKEVFPIELRNGMTIQGEDGADKCILSGAFNPDSTAAILRGNNLENITIKNLTIKDMKRTTENGGGCELIDCGGTIQGCVFQNNMSGVWLSTAERPFSFSGNIFSLNDYFGIKVSSSISGDISGNIFNGNGYTLTAYGSLFGGIHIVGTMKGNIFGNTFNENVSYFNYGGGVYVETLIGDITENTFTGNKSSSGGGASVDKLTGNITGNTFTGNSGGYNGGGVSVNTLIGNIIGNTFTENIAANFGGGAMWIETAMSGVISGNIFSKNSPAQASGGPGGICLNGGGGDTNIIIANNHFLHNSTNSNLTGAAIFSNQNITVINNTFYGDGTLVLNESQVNISNSAPNSVIQNNIFADTDTAVFEQGELNLAIDHNDFYNVTNILHRNSQPMGNDIDYIGMVLGSKFSDNHNWIPGLKGQVATGSLTQNPVYDVANKVTVFTDSSRSWKADELKNTVIFFPKVSRSYPVFSNTATEIKVLANIPDSAVSGDTYNIDDYHLAQGSSNINAGRANSDITTDFEGDIRPQGSAYDIGADEYAAPNSVPVANPQSVATREDKAVDITLTGTDADSDPLTYSVVTQPAHGALTGTAPNLTYTPAQSYSGSDSFSFKVSDGKAFSQPATVSITVKPNTVPVANPQSITTDEDTSVAVTLTGTDADGDPLTYSVVTQPAHAHGMLTGTAPNLSYKPAQDYNGTDSFTFKVNDEKADSAPATVSITVNPVNDPPALTYSHSPVIAVKLNGADVENDTLTYSVVTQPANGSISGTAPNLIYTPKSGFSGTDSFTVKANDGKADSQTVTVNITVGSSCSVVFDIGNDCKKGLEEAIDALQTITGVK